MNDAFDIMGISREQYEHEIYSRQEVLWRSSEFLYPRFRVACILLEEFDIFGKNSSELPFLYERDPDLAANYVREEYALRFDAHRHAFLKPGSRIVRNTAYFDDGHVPYIASDDQIRDGIDMYYAVRMYIEDHRDDIEQFKDPTGTGGIVKYARQILWNVRRLYYLDGEALYEAQRWFGLYEDYPVEMVLSNQTTSGPLDRIGAIVRYGDEQYENISGNAMSAIKNLIDRDVMLKPPFETFIGELFSAYLRSVQILQ